MGFIPQKFTKFSDMMLYPFMDTASTEKGCFLELRHRDFTGCDSNGECVFKMMPSPLRVSAKQFFSPRSDLKESEEFEKAAKSICRSRMLGLWCTDRVLENSVED